MKNAQLIVAVSRSLEAYADGDRAGALAALDGITADPIPDRPAWIANELERRTRDSQCPAAARDWISLARDRLRLESGEDVRASIPVVLALNSALTCLRA